MRVKSLYVFVALSLCVAKAGAAGVTIPAGDGNDMVYDGQRDIVYITNGNEILRYKVGSGSLLAPIVLHRTAVLMGIDLSPDSKTIAVADGAHTSQVRYLHLIDADTRVDNRQSFSTTISGEGGTFSVAYGINGDITATESYDGSGWTPFRFYDAKTSKWGMIGSPYEFTQNSILSASGNGRMVAFENSNISDGEWGTFDVTSQTFVHRTGYDDGTSTFNLTMATNAKGDQYLINGSMVYNNVYKKVTTLPGFDGVYDPVRPVAYLPIFNTSTVAIYDMTGFKQIGSIDVGYPFKTYRYVGYGSGRTRISRDGSLLMVNIGGGIFIDRLYAPLTARSVSATTAGQPVTVTATGTIGITGTITYGVAQQPAHGTASVKGNQITYTPNVGFTGTDAFNYQAHYGKAIASGTITIAVALQNHAPIAVLDSVNISGTKPILIPVLANDHDPDGQPLSITMVTQPIQGTTAIQGNEILYTPAANNTNDRTFIYTISDGHGGTSSARVVVHAMN